MKFLSDKADSITLYSETGKISQFDGGKVSFANGKLEISAQTAPLCFLRVRWNCHLPQGTRFCGDAWERTYGDAQWGGFDPSRMQPWYFFARVPD